LIRPFFQKLEFRVSQVPLLLFGWTNKLSLSPIHEHLRKSLLSTHYMPFPFYEPWSISLLLNHCFSPPPTQTLLTERASFPPFAQGQAFRRAQCNFQKYRFSLRSFPLPHGRSTPPDPLQHPFGSWIRVPSRNLPVNSPTLLSYDGYIELLPSIGVTGPLCKAPCPLGSTLHSSPLFRLPRGRSFQFPTTFSLPGFPTDFGVWLTFPVILSKATSTPSPLPSHDFLKGPSVHRIVLSDPLPFLFSLIDLLSISHGANVSASVSG